MHARAWARPAPGGEFEEGLKDTDATTHADWAFRLYGDVGEGFGIDMEDAFDSDGEQNLSEGLDFVPPSEDESADSELQNEVLVRHVTHVRTCAHARSFRINWSCAHCTVRHALPGTPVRRCSTLAT